MSHLGIILFNLERTDLFEPMIQPNRRLAFWFWSMVLDLGLFAVIELFKFSQTKKKGPADRYFHNSPTVSKLSALSSFQ